MLLGLAVLAAGLYMRFDTTQWDTMQSIHNGRLCVYIYMILGAAIFLLSIIGQYGAGKARRRFSLFVFQLGTLACLAFSLACHAQQAVQVAVEREGGHGDGGGVAVLSQE